MPSVMPMVISFTKDTLLAMPVLENCFAAWMALPDIAAAGDGFRPGGKVWCRRVSKNEKLSRRRYLAAVVSMRKCPKCRSRPFGKLLRTVSTRVPDPRCEMAQHAAQGRIPGVYRAKERI